MQAWKEPIQKLLSYWSQLEKRTKQMIDLLQFAAEGRCKVGESEQVPTSKKERKARDRRKKALGSVDDLLQRASNDEDKNALKSIYEPLADLMAQRAEMRELWAKREKDHVFHEMAEECRPLPV